MFVVLVVVDMEVLVIGWVDMRMQLVMRGCDGLMIFYIKLSKLKKHKPAAQAAGADPSR